MLTNLSHVRRKNHGNVACIHLVELFMLHNICHQIYSPIKQCSFRRRKRLYKLGTVIFCIAVHHLFWSERIKYSCRKFSEPCLQDREKRRRQERTPDSAMNKQNRKGEKRTMWKIVIQTSENYDIKKRFYIEVEPHKIDFCKVLINRMVAN